MSPSHRGPPRGDRKSQFIFKINDSCCFPSGKKKKCDCVSCVTWCETDAPFFLYLVEAINTKDRRTLMEVLDHIRHCFLLISMRCSQTQLYFFTSKTLRVIHRTRSSGRVWIRASCLYRSANSARPWRKTPPSRRRGRRRSRGRGRSTWDGSASWKAPRPGLWASTKRPPWFPLRLRSQTP